MPHAAFLNRYLYTRYFSLTCLSTGDRKATILSATKFHQRRKSPEHQGKMDQCLEVPRLTARERLRSFKSTYLTQENTHLVF